MGSTSWKHWASLTEGLRLEHSERHPPVSRLGRRGRMGMGDAKQVEMALLIDRRQAVGRRRRVWLMGPFLCTSGALVISLFPLHPLDFQLPPVSPSCDAPWLTGEEAQITWVLWNQQSGALRLSGSACYAVGRRLQAAWATLTHGWFGAPREALELLVKVTWAG